MITADQLVAHLVGDYVLQSDWMAAKKRTESMAAVLHAAVYTLPFVLFTAWGIGSGLSLVVIFLSHALIDRYGLARYVVWAKNFLAPRWIGVLDGVPASEVDRYLRLPPERRRPMRNRSWRDCQRTGYPPDRPEWLAVWLLIIADNVLHVLINGAALAWL